MIDSPTNEKGVPLLPLNICSQIAASAKDGNILVWSTTDNKVRNMQSTNTKYSSIKYILDLILANS